MVTKKADDAVAAAKKKSDDDGKKGDGVVDDKTKDGAKGKDKTPEVELSEEDAALKENLELMVMRASDPKAVSYTHLTLPTICSV